MAYNQGGLNGIDAISGVQPPTTSAIEKITLKRNYDSNPACVNNVYNQTQFLEITAQHTTTNFDPQKFDKTFNDGAGTVGMNAFFQKPATATKVYIG